MPSVPGIQLVMGGVELDLKDVMYVTVFSPIHDPSLDTYVKFS
jgi:hypothetical protein